MENFYRKEANSRHLISHDEGLQNLKTCHLKTHSSNSAKELKK
jgi:hypothetical protein